ncbi:putative aromatic-l-amino-acid decarboxylase protein [Phaeoacremonium minimum UCRPA7]|uniref:Putative aromatic-l-amino-acid decarboxylase protein n=1 Tax=Phaeoacremonium minimum (strain UCR-PA7) TaxID=1286976 RepID=R8BB93_PHAM7|nr:putative aromatic-l-amino-acid decarboxylase protein [Phaeoacremonium minimum UCRPA7]EON96603.1 putative aromatic-l-amino-acid decarboxylase protein [Phaeoacremonium minimum UCRPA7]
MNADQFKEAGKATIEQSPTLGGGVIQGTASEATLTVMVAARDKYLRETLPTDLSEEDLEEATIRKRGKLVALGSAAAHSATKKAAKILGVRFMPVPVRAEDKYAMTGAGLAAVLETCRTKGLEPFYLTTTLGTTDTCAVDDFGGIITTLSDDSLTSHPLGKPGEIWVHVDAAYAGAALVTPEAQEAVGISHLASFHSFDMNMHKWLLTNFDASTLFVRDRMWLVEALSADLHILRNTYSDGGLVTDYRNWQIPLGRRFRSLKIWFVLRSYGVKGLQAYIRRTTKNGELFAELLGSRPDLFEILTGPRFALTVFRMVGRSAGADTEEKNACTKELCETVNASGKIWITGTMLDGQFAIRVMTANQLTEEEHVRKGFQVIVETAEMILKSK